MKGQYLVNNVKNRVPEADIYGDKSALVLNWLFTNAQNGEAFSVRGVAKESGVSLGQVQKIFANLVNKGVLYIKGKRTAKKFIFQKPQALLHEWEEKYDFVKKAKIYTYRTGLVSAKEILTVLERSKFRKYIVLSLHTAAQAKGLSNTNLDSIEIYLLDTKIREKLEQLLELEPQERGYEVLIAEPYYKSWLRSIVEENKLSISPDLLTYLDLANYPLRGREQADGIRRKSPDLKWIKNAK